MKAWAFLGGSRLPVDAFWTSAIVLTAVVCLSTSLEAQPSSWRFDFGGGPVAKGFTPVGAADEFSRGRGYGFEPGAAVVAVDRGGDDEVRGDFVTSDAAFFFSIAVPEGNYRVTVSLGDRLGTTDTTVKAELRRLMLESVTTTSGLFETRTFIVNVRRPRIAAVRDIQAGEVRLKAPRETTQEAWAWDNALTLEFNGSRPAVCALEIVRVDVPTVFLLGDSTVCDQSREPYASWGQMFTRFFEPTVAIANHAESGETYRDSLGRRRLDKILSVMKPGDYLFMQFGHNDQKQIAAGTGGPFTTYKDEIKRHVDGVRAAGGVPVLLSPMERRAFDDEGRVVPSLADYAEAARQAAKELEVAFIDLNAMSKPLYEALEAHGPDYSKRAFAPNDNTHHNNYGAYQIAKCVVAGLRELELELVEHLQPELPEFDPAEPDPLDRFSVPASPLVTHLRPLGDETPAPAR
jgi:lysophospholipase L1-like esterase